MKHTLKRIAALLMAALLLCAGTAFAATDGYEFGTLGKKTAEALVKPGQYEITLSVPGAVASEEYSEIIVMVDASSSQGANLNKLKETLVDIAEQVLHNDGSMRLTLMGFGMGPALVGSFYNAQTLDDYLADVTQADLRQGVSATNCEAALQFVTKYINKSEKLGKTYVLFTSDGMTNMDETAFELLTWQEHSEWYMSGANPADIAGYAAGGQADLLITGGPILSPTARLYPELSAAVEVAAVKYGVKSDEHIAAVDALYAGITGDENCADYVTAAFEDVIRFGQKNELLDGNAASTSEYEKAFLAYADGAMTNAYLCTIHGMAKAAFYPDWYNLGTWGARAAAAADKLAGNEKVLELCMLDFSNKGTTWMNPASTGANHVTSSKIKYESSNNYTATIDKMIGLTKEMFTTVYENATVVDPMSKWVTNPYDIRIYEDDLLIYEDGSWLYEDKQPAANPITLSNNADGRTVITWRIKDGPLLYTDRYFLKYKVDVDETAEGFQYGTEYLANDPTHVEYVDENGVEQERDIPVPDVKENQPADTFEEGEKGIRIYKGTPEGKPLSDITFEVYRVVPAPGEQLTPRPAYEEYSKYAVPANLVATLTTDGAGYAAFNMTKNGCEEGFYLIIERDSDKVVKPVEPFYISVPMPDPVTGELMNVVDIYPKNTTNPEEEPDLPPVIPDEPEYDDEGRLTIIKHAQGSTSTVLEGAQFQVYRLAEAGEEYTLTAVVDGQEVGIVPVMNGGEPVIITSGANGVAQSPVLPCGLYFIVETQAPAGYNLLDAPIAVFVTNTSAEVAVYVANIPGVQLPETGGPGTVMLNVSGMALCCAALLMVLRKTRRAA